MASLFLPAALLGAAFGAALGACSDAEPAEPAPRAHTASTSSTAAPLTAQPAAKRSFVPGEVILKTKLEVIPHTPLALGGVSVIPAEQLPSGSWRVLLEDPVAANARLARAAGATVSNASLAQAEQVTRDALAAIAADADVQVAHLNGLAELSEVRTLIDPTQDPFYQYQRWNYEAIRLPQAWQRVSQTSFVRLAIIDSENGGNLHPDLLDRWTDAASMGPNTHLYHHGAHVAGIAGATAGNGYGVGVCWQCRLAPYQMDLSFSQIERAITYAAGNGGDPPRVHAMNLSLNFANRPDNEHEALLCAASAQQPETEGIRLAIARAVSRGVAVVISAGNHSLTRSAFPADCPGAISVAATQPNGTIAEYSNRGPGVTLAAPGGGGRVSDQSMYGAWLPAMPCQAPFGLPGYGPDPYSGTAGVVAPWASYEDPIPSNKYCYRYLSGTSMAAPHVTGTIGLMLTRHGGLTPAQIRDILVRTARPNTACPAGTCGAGLLNADAAVRYATDAGVPQGTLADHNFGSVNVGGQKLGTARITNTGSAPLTTSTVLTIAGSNGQMEFAFTDGFCGSGQLCTRPGLTVPVGGTLDLPIRCRPAAAGAITGTLLFYTNRLDESTGATDVTLAAQLSCNGRPSQPGEELPDPDPGVPPVDQ